MILLDTNALIFWTLDLGKLTDRADEAIRQAVKISISSISLWEVGIKNNKGMLELPLPFRDYVDRLRSIDHLDILPVNDQIWVTNVDLDWEHRDPADRTIVATAMIHNLSLITSDSRIRAFYSDTIW